VGKREGKGKGNRKTNRKRGEMESRGKEGEEEKKCVFARVKI
jgi:hypothetical protein